MKKNLAIIFSVAILLIVLLVMTREQAAIFYTDWFARASVGPRAARTAYFGWDQASSTYAEVQLAGQGSSTEAVMKPVSVLDGEGNEYRLRGGKLIVSNRGAIIWQSPDDWLVVDFAFADADHDGAGELALDVWKAGDFGASKSPRIKENDQSVKNHLFVYRLTGGKLMPVWQSSNLDRPNCEFLFADLDGDGLQELAALEGEYAIPGACQGKYLAVWKWQEWGFYNQWRSDKAIYTDLRTAKADGQDYLEVKMTK